MPVDGNDWALLRSASLFAALSREDFALFIGEPRYVTLARGEYLFYQDDPVTAFYVVLDGWITLVRDQRDGTRTVIKIVGPGESFAEAMLTPGDRYPVSAEAASEARVVPFETKRIRVLMKDNPDLSLSIIAATFRQLKLLVDQIEHLKSWSIERRLAQALIQMAGCSEGACEFQLPIDQNLIASRLSVTASTLSRTFKKLEPFGVSARRGHVAIEDVAALIPLVDGVDDLEPSTASVSF